LLAVCIITILALLSAFFADNFIDSFDLPVAALQSAEIFSLLLVVTFLARREEGGRALDLCESPLIGRGPPL
jgi:hypothetical protein